MKLRNISASTSVVSRVVISVNLGFLEFTSPAGSAVTPCNFHVGRNEAQGTYKLPRAAGGTGKFSSTDTWCLWGSAKPVEKQLPAPAARSFVLLNRQRAPLQGLRSPWSRRGNGCAGKRSYVLGSVASGQQELPERSNCSVFYPMPEGCCKCGSQAN